MANSLGKALEVFFTILISIVGIIGLGLYVGATIAKIALMFLIIGLLIYLPGKIFGKKADEFYDELNGKENE